MSWEKKFNLIINDTKANLSRVKNKYDSNGPRNVTWAPTSYSTPIKRSTSLLDIPIASTSMYPQVSSLNQSYSNDGFYNGVVPPSSSFIPYPSTQTLLEKLDQQNIAMDHLRGIVHRLETDRHNYKEQIRDLRNEVYQLTEKSSERRPDPSTERRIEQMRRELLGEIQLVQSQLQLSSAKGNSSCLSDTQLLAMNRDVLEIKHAFRDELEGFRRDVEILRSRTAKLELELANVLTGRREVERRQDSLDRTLNLLTHSQKKSQIPPSTIAFMDTNRHLDKLQLGDLRMTLSALKDKINMFEQSSQTVARTAKKPQKFKAKSVLAHGKLKPVNNDLLDDTDLSEGGSSESSDFAEFQPDVMIEEKLKTLNPNEVDVDTDGLDIDDLDLSDDDIDLDSSDEIHDNDNDEFN